MLNNNSFGITTDQKIITPISDFVQPQPWSIQDKHLDHLNVDISPLHIENSFSIIVVLLVHAYLLYRLSYKILYIRVVNQSCVNGSNINIDIFDKITLLLCNKLLLFNILGLCLFQQINSLSSALCRSTLVLFIAIVFIKLATTRTHYFILWCIKLLIVFSIEEVIRQNQVPMGKISVIFLIIIIGITLQQTYRTTRLINNAARSATTSPSRQRRLSLNPLNLIGMFSVGNQQNSYGDRNQRQLSILNFPDHIDSHILIHLQNRRAFCITVCTSLFVSVLFLWNLEDFKQYFGQIFVGLATDCLPVYALIYNYDQWEDQNKGQNYATQFSESDSMSARSSHVYIQLVERVKK